MFLSLAQAATAPVPSFSPWLWAGFVAFILVAMLIDLGLGKSGKAMTTKTALAWCAVWIGCALAFNAGIWHYYGYEYAEQFFAGYLLEYSLSVDNLFVFVLVFAFFRTPPHLQHRALVWGIIGAMVLRASMILVGAALIHRWKGVLVLFGVFLVYSGIAMLFHDDEDDPSEKWWVRFLERRLPLTDGYRGDKFFVYEAAPIAPAEEAPADEAAGKGVGEPVGEPQLGPVKLMVTRLFLVVLVIEASDVMFAVDSVPAIFGVTEIPFIVFTSNMFAILGLRSLFFALSGAIQQLRYLNYGLALVLAFIGVKMILAEGPLAIEGIWGLFGAARPEWLPAHGIKITVWQSLLVILSLLVVTIGASLLIKPAPSLDSEDEDEGGRLSDSGRHLLSSSSENLRPVTAGEDLGVPPEEGEVATPRSTEVDLTGSDPGDPKKPSEGP